MADKTLPIRDTQRLIFHYYFKSFRFWLFAWSMFFVCGWGWYFSGLVNWSTLLGSVWNFVFTVVKWPFVVLWGNWSALFLIGTVIWVIILFAFIAEQSEKSEHTLNYERQERRERKAAILRGEPYE